MSDDAAPTPAESGVEGAVPTPPEPPIGAGFVPPSVPVAPAAPAVPAVPVSPTQSAPPAVPSQSRLDDPPVGPPVGADAPPPFSRPASAVFEQPAAPRRRGWAPVLAGIAIGAVIGGASGAGAALLLQPGGSGPGMPVSGPQTITINDHDDATLVSAVAAAAMPSVVTISVIGASGSGTGSGVVLDDEGHIVTNSHVVTLGGLEAEPSIRVTTSSGRVYDAEIIGIDPLMDLAVVKVAGAPELVPIEFADSSDLNVGDVTIAIGAPLGLAGTVTSGIVSSLDRSIEVASSAVPGESADSDAPLPDAPESTNPFDFFRFDLPESSQGSAANTGLVQLAVIQTDTAINSGNSGGALLDDDGRLIGVNVAIATGGGMNRGNIGVGFAIPANVVERITGELIEHGEASHGLLGVSVANVMNDPAQADATVIGASVVTVVSGGAADAAGLRVADIVIGLDGVSISNKTDLTAQVRTHAAGATVEIVYVRGDQIRTADVTLGDLAELLG